LDPQVAVGPLRRRWPFGDPDGSQRPAQREHVGQHVPGVRDQSEAAGEIATQSFDYHVDGGERERDRQPRTIYRCRRSVAGLHRGSCGMPASGLSGLTPATIVEPLLIRVADRGFRRPAVASSMPTVFGMATRPMFSLISPIADRASRTALAISSR